MSLRSLFRAPKFEPFQTILNFKTPSTVPIITRCDQEIGGYSKVQFTQPTVGSNFQYASFSGYLNLDIPKNNPEVTRSGYAMFRTGNQVSKWFRTNQYWDWSPFLALVMRLRGDTRKYLINIQANTPLITDLFQHRLFLNTPGEWETVIVPLNDFVMTNWGVIQDVSELNKPEIKSFGIGLLDKQYGPFKLDIEWVKVVNNQELLKYTNDVPKEPQSQPQSALTGHTESEPNQTIF